MQWVQMHHDDPDMQDSPVARMPLDVAMSRIPQDPAGFQQWKQMAALGIDEYIKRNTLTAEQESMAADRTAGRKYQQDTLGETRRHNRATEDIQSRQEERLAAAAKAPKDEKPTVTEQRDAYNVGRVISAARQIASQTAASPSSKKPSAMEAFVGEIPGIRGAVGAIRSAPRQVVVSAQRDMIDSLLYLSTGAAYNKEQYEGQIDSYLPQYLDKDETVQAKAERLRDLIQSAKVRVGKAWTPEMDAAVASLNIGGKPTADASSAPPGVDAATWNVMTPEERALWQK